MSETTEETQKEMKRVSWGERIRIVCRWNVFEGQVSSMMGAVEVEWMREWPDRTAR